MGSRTLIAKLALISPMRIVRPSSSLLRVRSLTTATATASPFVGLPPIVPYSILGDPYWSLISLSPHGLSQALRRCIFDSPMDNCDLEHWFVILEPPEPTLTRDQITVSYIKTLAEVLGSEEEAKKSIYSVYHLAFAFGCIMSEELSYKIKTLPKVRWVLPDPFSDLPHPLFDSSDIERRISKIGVQDNARDIYFQRPSKNMQKYDENVLDHDIRMRIQEMKRRGCPRKRYFVLQHTYQLVEEGYGYPERVNEGYQEGNQGYQGGSQGYQARNLGGSMPGGSGYQASNSYQGHGPGYQGGAPAYGGDAFGYEGGGAGPVHGQTGGSSSYQGCAGPNFQTGGPAGPGCEGIHNYHADGAYYQGRDLVKEAMAVTFKQVGQLMGPAGPDYQGSPDYQDRDLPGRDQ